MTEIDDIIARVIKVVRQVLYVPETFQINESTTISEIIRRAETGNMDDVIDLRFKLEEEFGVSIDGHVGLQNIRQENIRDTSILDIVEVVTTSLSVAGK